MFPFNSHAIDEHLRGDHDPIKINKHTLPNCLEWHKNIAPVPTDKPILAFQKIVVRQNHVAVRQGYSLSLELRALKLRQWLVMRGKLPIAVDV